MQVIEKAAERGELTELVLMVIWNRLDVARRDVCKSSVLTSKSCYLQVLWIVYFYVQFKSYQLEQNFKLVAFYCVIQGPIVCW